MVFCDTLNAFHENKSFQEGASSSDREQEWPAGLQVLLPTAPVGRSTAPSACGLWLSLAQKPPWGTGLWGRSRAPALPGLRGCQVCFGRDSATPADLTAPRTSGLRAAFVPWSTRSLSVSQPRVQDGHHTGHVPRRLCQLLCKAPCPSHCGCLGSPGGCFCCPEPTEQGSVC